MFEADTFTLHLELSFLHLELSASMETVGLFADGQGGIIIIDL